MRPSSSSTTSRRSRRTLNHPVHEPLGAWFWKTSEATLVYDYELTDASNVSEFLG